MLTASANSRPNSRLRLLTLFAVAHASLALYLWFCAFDIALVIVPVQLWEGLTWSWVGWPVLLVVRCGRPVARHVDWAGGRVNGRRHHCGTLALRPNLAFNADAPVRVSNIACQSGGAPVNYLVRPAASKEAYR